MPNLWAVPERITQMFTVGKSTITITVWRLGIETGWYPGEPIKLIGIDVLSHEDLSDIGMCFVTFFNIHVLRFAFSFYVDLAKG